jgi:hypothetical protein
MQRTLTCCHGHFLPEPWGGEYALGSVCRIGVTNLGWAASFDPGRRGGLGLLTLAGQIFLLARLHM